MTTPRRQSLRTPLAFLVLVYAVVLGAEWIAPYDSDEQHRSLPLAPPTRLHFTDAEGSWSPRPFVHRLAERPEELGVFFEDERERFPVRFFVEGEPRRWGPFEVRRRLFGVGEGGHVLLAGTDRFGRDVFSRLIYGGRVSLGVGLLAGLIAVGLGLALGTAAGYLGGRPDALLMRVGELFMALPSLFLLVAVRAALPLDLEPATTLLVTILVISLASWVRPARLVRAVVLSERERDYVLAARGFGAGDFYLVRRHVLPRTLPVVLVHLSLVVPRLVLAEVTLSFLGLGVAEPMASWGLMLAELSRESVLVRCWWMSAPAVALTGVVIGYHRLASVLRRRFGDPVRPRIKELA